LDQIVALTTETCALMDRIPIGPSPQGIDLSIDGDRLFAALADGTVGVLDLETRGVSRIPVGAALGHPRVYDVLEVKPNRLFASASAGSSVNTYLDETRLDQGNAAARVADGARIGGDPVFELSPDRRFLYVGAGFPSSRIHKLDLDGDGAPISLGSWGLLPADHLESSPDGRRLYLSDGQVLRSGSLRGTARIAPGIPDFGDIPEIVHVARKPDLIESYDARTSSRVDQHQLPCSLGAVRRLATLPRDAGWIALGDDRVCGLSADSDGDGVLNHLDACPLDGRLYGGGTGEDGGRLYRIDPMSGSSELVGSTGLTSVTGLTLARSFRPMDCGAFQKRGEDGLSFNGSACVAIDVRLGSERDPIQPRSRGVLPVALLDSDGFDVRDVDVSSLGLGRGSAPASQHGRANDLDGDGRADLLLHFRTADAETAPGDRRICLVGRLRDGTSFEGCDAITTVGSGTSSPGRPE
jgi:hypothetical protein